MASPAVLIENALLIYKFLVCILSLGPYSISDCLRWAKLACEIKLWSEGASINMQTRPPWLCHSWVQSSCTQNWISKDHLLRSHFLSDNQSWYIFLFCCDHLIHSVCSKCRSCQFLKISSFLCYFIDNSDTSLRSYRGPCHFIKGFLILV